MFYSHYLFNKYQRIILKALKSREVRDRFSVSSDVGEIVQISPNSFSEYKGHESHDRVRLLGRFYIHNKFSDLLELALAKIDIAAQHDEKVTQDVNALYHYAGYKNNFAQYPMVLFNTFDKNDATAHTEGSGFLTASDPSWSTIHSATTSDTGGSLSGGNNYTRSSVDGGGTKNLSKGFLVWDTSSMRSGATINSAFFDLTPSHVVNALEDAFSYLNIFSSTQASNTSLANADFDAHGSTKFISDIDIGSQSVDSEITNITINSSGLSNIDPASFSSFCLREGHDIDNQDPGGTNDESRLGFHGTVSSKEAELNVDYTPLPSGGSLLFNFV